MVWLYLVADNLTREMEKAHTTRLYCSCRVMRECAGLNAVHVKKLWNEYVGLFIVGSRKYEEEDSVLHMVD